MYGTFSLKFRLGYHQQQVDQYPTLKSRWVGTLGVYSSSIIFSILGGLLKNLFKVVFSFPNI